MRFVHDGEDAACLANVQRVSAQLADEVAEPAHGTDIARAATVVADGWAHAIPVPAGAADGPTGCCDLTQEARSLAQETRRQAIHGGLRLGRMRR
jgi:hypothetical protein